MLAAACTRPTRRARARRVGPVATRRSTAVGTAVRTPHADEVRGGPPGSAAAEQVEGEGRRPEPDRQVGEQRVQRMPEPGTAQRVLGRAGRRAGRPRGHAAASPPSRGSTPRRSGRPAATAWCRLRSLRCPVLMRPPSYPPAGSRNVPHDRARRFGRVSLGTPCTGRRDTRRGSDGGTYGMSTNGRQQRARCGSGVREARPTRWRVTVGRR